MKVVNYSHPQTLDIVDLAIHGVVCQKYDLHGERHYLTKPNTVNILKPD
jgi:hypothetical protein